MDISEKLSILKVLHSEFDGNGVLEQCVLPMPDELPASENRLGTLHHYNALVKQIAAELRNEGLIDCSCNQCITPARITAKGIDLLKKHNLF